MLALFLLAGTAYTQKPAHPEEEIKAVINTFFEGLESGDSAKVRSTCTSSVRLESYVADRQGVQTIHNMPFSKFLESIGRPHKDSYNEEIEFKSIQFEQSLASVWTPYTFYINEKVSHTGTNSFQLINTPEGWKIHYIIDTRRFE